MTVICNFALRVKSTSQKNQRNWCWSTKTSKFIFISYLVVYFEVGSHSVAQTCLEHIVNSLP